MHPLTKEAYKLFHDGSLALADFEQNGILIDVPYYEKQKAFIARKIEHYKKIIFQSEEVLKWKKIYSKKFNFDSNQQLADILFNHFKYKAVILTAKEKPSVSEEALNAANIPLANDILELRKLAKLKSTYIENILRETVDGILRPSFSLHIPTSFRSSSQNPNFQNIPNRDPYAKKIIRRGFIPPKDYLFGGADYSGAEVRMACCASNDPDLIADVTDPERDMHRDMAMECYLLAIDEVTDILRSIAKNKFVFPQFYGDWFLNCAEGLWEMAISMGAKTAKGVPILEHLASKGIKNLKKFTDHIEKVEDYFWNERYKTFNQYKIDQWNEYQKKGYIDLLTGFRCYDLLRKNECLNRPIQGPAFHWLLWSAIKVNKISKKRKMRSRIIGQIHDELTFVTHKDEVNEFLELVKKVMTLDIRRHWEWINVPLDVEFKLAAVNKSWYHTKKAKTGIICQCGSKYTHRDKSDALIKWNCPVCGEEEYV